MAHLTDTAVKHFMSQWSDNSLYINAHTSGSTGTPATIQLLKEDMRSSARATNRFFGIDSSSVLGLPLSPEYIAGKMMIVRALEANCRIAVMPVSNKIIIPEPLSLLSVVPSQLQSLLNDDNVCYKVKNLLIGGSPLSAQQEKNVALSGINAWLGYGMTETCSHVALRRIGSGNVFHAMPEIEFDVDYRGCLIIKSTRFSWRTMTTNDSVELLSPTSFRWLGRVDNVVNSGGIKLHPEEIEEKLRSLLPDIPDFYLIGEPDESLGERLIMVSTALIDLQKVREVLGDGRLTPKRIIITDSLPRTANGKIYRIIPGQKQHNKLR